MTCSRCKKLIDGCIDRDQDGKIILTGGFYDCEPPSMWAAYRKPGEVILCDSCLWQDPAFIQKYGVRTR